MYNFILNMIKTIMRGGNYDRVIPLLTDNFFQTYKGAWNIISGLSKSVAIPIAIMLVTLYFILDVVEGSTSGQTFEKFLSSTLKYVFTLFFIFNAVTLLTYFVDLGRAVIAKSTATGLTDAQVEEKAVNLMNEVFADGNDAKEAMAGEFKTVIILRSLQFVIPYLIMFFSQFIMISMAYTRMIEIMVRIGFAPIGFADIYTSGLSGGAGRYLRGFIAVCLQGALMVASAVVVSSMVTTALNPATGADGSMQRIVQASIITFVGAGVTYKSQEIARELLGA